MAFFVPAERMLERRSLYKGFISQPAHCAECDRPVTLHVLQPARFPVAVRSVPWICPFCKSTGTVEIAGRLALISRGVPDMDPGRPPDAD